MSDEKATEHESPGRADATHLEFLAARKTDLRRLASTAAGTFLGAGYAWGGTLFVTRLHEGALATYSFLAGVPLVLALLPYLRSKGPTGYTAFFKPLAGILLFTFVLWMTGFESGLCLVLIGLPLLSLTGLFALALLLIPLGLACAEARWLPYQSTEEVSAEVVIRANPSRIWSGILRVSPLTESEIPANWLQRLGVPRPVYATLDSQHEGGLRKGHFEGGLMFLERVVTYHEERELGLSVRVDPSSLRSSDLLAHAVSTGLLRLDDVRYRLVPSIAAFV